MATYQLNETDTEDLEDVIGMIEKSFGFSFEASELREVGTFGKLCDAVLAKIELAPADDCTSQQAFYQLRRALSSHLAPATITPTTRLADLLPASRRQRQQITDSIEATLGVKPSFIGPSDTTVMVLVLAGLASLAAFFAGPGVGFSAILLVIAGAEAASKFGNTLQSATIREVVEKMTCQHYLKFRRHPTTVNRTEIVPHIQALFRYKLDIMPADLTRDASWLPAAQKKPPM
ncbi:hypothetical protein [uncultured Hymenobacter sp.]|uniref:hypothetical protein n=1 Tax=uncultured Hymenobacter sp. TaxID=170016 RepID=UPI0035CC437F